MIPTQRSSSPVNRLRSEMDELFNGVFGNFFQQPTRTRSSDPALDIFENADGYRVEVAVPGLSLDELDVSVAENTMTIRGERQGEETRGGTYLRRERRRTGFQRAVMLPKTVNPDGIEASLENGILTICIPRAEAAKPRQIEVRVTQAVESAPVSETPTDES